MCSTSRKDRAPNPSPQSKAVGALGYTNKNRSIEKELFEILIVITTIMIIITIVIITLVIIIVIVIGIIRLIGLIHEGISIRTWLFCLLVPPKNLGK